MEYEKYLEKAYELLTLYGLKLIAALVIFVIGRWVAKIVGKIIERVMKRKDIDPTIIAFVSNLSNMVLLAFVVIAALSQVGIQTTSFIALLGAAGLAIGLALQGSLSNFAAGFLMIIFRPFRVGDYVEVAGVEGDVEEILIFTTTLKTKDNKIIIIPNAQISNGNIINYTSAGIRRVDMVFGIGYGDDIDQAKTLFMETIKSDSRILDDPAPQVALSELGDSSVNFVVRPWVNAVDYWDVMFDVTEAVKKRMDAQGLSIPFPQQDVHMYQHNGE